MKDFVGSPFIQYAILVLAVLGGIMAIKAAMSGLQNNELLRPIAMPILRYG